MLCFFIKTKSNQLFGFSLYEKKTRRISYYKFKCQLLGLQSQTLATVTNQIKGLNANYLALVNYFEKVGTLKCTMFKYQSTWLQSALQVYFDSEKTQFKYQLLGFSLFQMECIMNALTSLNANYLALVEGKGVKRVYKSVV